MAAVAATADMTIQKNSHILVHVEEALADLIVVSYSAENKKFQGVLLDSNKGKLPFGVYNLHPALSRQAAPGDTNDDKLHSASQRFLYEDPDYESKVSQKKKPGPKSKPQPRQKMTVRLRPRKVLCSNCKGICNENNENVDVSKKRKLDSDEEAPRETDSSRGLSDQKKYLMAGGMLIPKLSRLHPSEISSAIKGVSKNSNKASEKPTKSVKSNDDSVTPGLAFVSVSREIDEHNTKTDDASYNTMFSSARTLKICFGEGEGTVVKIPPLSGDFNEDSGVSCDMNKPESKAAKRALRKAKKQAKRNSLQAKKMAQSPKHIGALSPRNIADSPALDPLEKRHKHRVKHKKKYKTAKKRDENSGKDSEGIDYFSDIKEHCMNQKLSISLRRLSSNSFERLNDVIANSDTEGEMAPDSTEGVGLLLFNLEPSSYLLLEDKNHEPYEEAVKRGTIKAEENESQAADPLASPSYPLGSPSTLASHSLPSPARSLDSPSTLAQSPHQVDVFS
ncbi:PWWP domain-containing protein [Operophtera brumata]|uniref:PWWP domain-containing protein n=1 Tax=Operophtera brumata TaxID=104452 RepID=A0A0L7LT37_OPEBR|nr:PWWP domain-containing protein [Operophtera brumata]